MKIVIWSLLSIYLIGFAFVLVVEVGSGPVTLGLSLVRASVWPIYITTGWPKGQRARMD